MIEEAYISLKTARLAKEKKVYIEGCCAVYSADGYIARTPNGGQWNWSKYKNGEFYLRYTQSLLARWLREKYNIYVEIDIYFVRLSTEENPRKYATIYWCKVVNNYNPICCIAQSTFEEAMEVGLQEALKMLP